MIGVHGHSYHSMIFLFLIFIYRYTEITCNDPPTIDNGDITNIEADSDQVAPFAFNTRVTYACDKGFHLSGDSVLTCSNGNGTMGRWSGMEPCCDRKSYNNGLLECSITDSLHKIFSCFV